MEKQWESNKKVSLLVMVMFLRVVNLLAQAPDTLWTKIYGGTDLDVGRSVQQTSDGGYIIAGYTFSFGEGTSDVWLIKTDVNGDTLWTKTYGGEFEDYSYSVQETTDDGFIIVGQTLSLSGIGIYIMKTDADGYTLCGYWWILVSVYRNSLWWILVSVHRNSLYIRRLEREFFS
ncbi:hypothetical protein CH333_09875 [candidate division WOR-3 bacterium JGI_Cruoil_03_44_89]|uniref:Bulb-type lectin domain-containing protein n=1 Tax=candidate division WOR-3 bacterium JGI_Cruoil_03_44_89 TaxID=1973748 RepID=A0A235BNQ5_UNCW3|nr:MAG: hypothetical protein CH333_09875 [candidate division WOR-3 bacterium JGI_Cruoil_03_44_89]